MNYEIWYGIRCIEVKYYTYISHCLLVIYPFFSVKYPLFSFKPDSVKFLAWISELFEFGFWQSRLMPLRKPDWTLKLCTSKCFSRKFTASKGIDQIDLIHSLQYPDCHEIDNGALSCKQKRTQQQQPLNEVVHCTSTSLFLAHIHVSSN